MRGRSGVLHTGHALHDTSGDRVAAATASTVVHFADLTDDEIDAYVATGEPLHVAGAFTVDGLGGAFVTGIQGDHHNVVGLSLPLLRDLLAELGHSWTGLWRPPQLPGWLACSSSPPSQCMNAGMSRCTGFWKTYSRKR